MTTEQTCTLGPTRAITIRLPKAERERLRTLIAKRHGVEMSMNQYLLKFVRQEINKLESQLKHQELVKLEAELQA